MFTEKEIKYIAAWLDTGNDDFIIGLEGKLQERFEVDMPYGVQKARDGDPIVWLFDHLIDTFNKYNIEGLQKVLNHE